MRVKTCKCCKLKFLPQRQMQTTCSFNCAMEYSKILNSKKKRKTLKQFNDSDVSVLKRKAQIAFNAYIRKRDENLNCISCDHNFNSDKPRQRHAGHYRPQGGHSLLRYDERNCHVQCSICNNYKSGNLADYRLALIEKIGLEVVEELESIDTTKRWSVEELQEIIKTYKFKMKELNDRMARVDSRK